MGIGITDPQYKLHVLGDIAATSFVNISTITEKKDMSYLNVSDESNILQKIKNTNVATYYYNWEKCGSGTDSSASPQNDNCKKRLGLIAEQAPEEVLAASGKGVDIYKMASFLLAGMKAREKKIEELQQQLSVSSYQSSGSNTNAFSVDQTNGLVNISFFGKITGYLGKWSVDEGGEVGCGGGGDEEIKSRKWGYDQRPDYRRILLCFCGWRRTENGEGRVWWFDNNNRDSDEYDAVGIKGNQWGKRGMNKKGIEGVNKGE